MDAAIELSEYPDEATLERAVRRLHAELCQWLPADRAEERARNLAQGLMGLRGAEVTRVCCEAMDRALARRQYATRLYVALRLRNAWTREVSCTCGPESAGGLWVRHRTCAVHDPAIQRATRRAMRGSL